MERKTHFLHFFFLFSFSSTIYLRFYYSSKWCKFKRNYDTFQTVNYCYNLHEHLITLLHDRLKEELQAVEIKETTRWNAWKSEAELRIEEWVKLNKAKPLHSFHQSLSWFLCASSPPSPPFSASLEGESAGSYCFLLFDFSVAWCGVLWIWLKDETSKKYFRQGIIPFPLSVGGSFNLADKYKSRDLQKRRRATPSPCWIYLRRRLILMEKFMAKYKFTPSTIHWTNKFW